MAKVLGKSGRYVSEEATRKRRKVHVVTLLTGMMLGAVFGGFVGLLFQNLSNVSWTRLLIVVGIGVSAFVLVKISDKKTDALWKEREKLLKGAIGEARVEVVLNDFPDDFYVIHDITTEAGNLDHIVVGPTGVFVIDAKNWRGVIESDGNEELLLNGKPSKYAVLKQFTGRFMGVREKIKTLMNGSEPPYFQGIFAFTSARVDANFGTTGYVLCMRDDQLFEQIVQKKCEKELKKEEVRKIAQALAVLARMDVDFDTKKESQPVEKAKDS